MKYLLTLLAVMFSIITFAESKEIQGKLEETLLLSAGETAIITDFRITLVSVNDDGCGRARECYWIAYRDATFQVWQGDEDLGQITLSKASREDSRLFARVGGYYLVLKDALGYDTELATATFYLSNVEPYIEQ